MVQKLLQHHITVTYFKGPKGAHFPSQGEAAPCPSPKSVTASLPVKERHGLSSNQRPHQILGKYRSLSHQCTTPNRRLIPGKPIVAAA